MFRLFKNKSPSDNNPNVIDVVNYFITNLKLDWSTSNYYSISSDAKISFWEYSRIHALCYLTQVWSLVLNKKLLFNEINFETSTNAFTLNNSIYIHKVKKYLESNKKEHLDKYKPYNFNKEDELILQEVIRVYGGMNNNLLNSFFTRDEAYKQAKSNGINNHNKIDMDLAYEYYNNLYLDSIKKGR